MDFEPLKTKNNRPVISYGIILYTFHPELNENIYLFIRRKNSFGFIDFMKGNYNLYNTDHLKLLVNEMTVNEKKDILHKDFNELWCQLWSSDMNTNVLETNSDFCKSRIKFNLLKSSNVLLKILENSETCWQDPEWEFPKGRMNSNEKHLECSIREFVEETGVKKERIHIIENILPFEEHFIGTNYKSYTYKYYLSYMKFEDYKNTSLEYFQKSEVSKLEWVSLDTCLQKIRPYHLEKIKLIKNINNVLNEYSLYH